MPDSQPAIRMQDVAYSYADKVAVDGVSLTVERGEIFGFLGPNGAGKSTTIRLLTSLLRPQRGSVEVLGHRLPEQELEAKRRTGVVLQEPSYEYNLNVESGLELYGLMWGVPRGERKRRAEALMEEFGLLECRRTRIHDLSIGMRRRVQVAREFMHDMDLLFLDEPTIGLDVVSRRKTLDIIKERAEGGLTVFFTTHALDEADYLCHRIAVINKGRIMAVDTPRRLKDAFGGVRTIEIQASPEDALVLASELRRLDSLRVASDSAGTVQVMTEDPTGAFQAISGLLDEKRIRPIRMSLVEPSLEQAFMNMVTEEAPP